MTYLQSIILGIIQGLTEFLPISSSAHLVIAPHLFGWNIPEAQIFPFDVLVQMGTLVAVILYFWSDLWQILKAFFKGLTQRKPFEDPNARLGWFLILATLPAVLFGFLLKDKVEAAFGDIQLTAYFLFATAAFLVLGEILGKRNRKLTTLTWFDALWVGLFQALAIFPGISRSGATITGGMTRNLERPAAARFSFLMSIPAMLGAGFLSMLDVIKMPGVGSFMPVILVGIVAALLVGYLSIHWLLSFLAKRSFYVFAIYCVVIGTVVLITGVLRSKAQATSIETVTEQPPLAETLPVAPAADTLDQNPLTVAYTPALEWLLPAMGTCAQTIGDFSIITHMYPADQLSSAPDAIHLRWGAPDGLLTNAAILGTERLALIVNPLNPLIGLTPDLVQNIVLNQVVSWGNLADICAECFSNPPGDPLSSNAPQLNVYPAGEEPQDFFLQKLMAGQSIAGADALLIPGGTQMIAVVAAEPAAFGFVPAHFIESSVKEIPISGIDAQNLEMPILAMSSGEPAGQTRDWLICLTLVLNP